jgi:hypothetical protein
MGSSASGGAWNRLESELLLEDSESAFDLPEITKMLSGNASVSANAGGDEVDMLVGPVMVLHHGVTVPSHFPGDIGGSQKPVIPR